MIFKTLTPKEVSKNKIDSKLPQGRKLICLISYPIYMNYRIPLPILKFSIDISYECSEAKIGLEGCKFIYSGEEFE